MNSETTSYEFLAGAAPPRGSVTSWVTSQLRDAIVSLDLAPGSTLDKGPICDRLGVSRFPVSEAFARLQAEGLVDIAPQRGSTVSLVRLGDVAQYMLIRKALESEAVRMLVGRHTDALLAALSENLDAQRVAVARGDRTGFHVHDLRFHDMLVGAMGYARVSAVIDSARANLDRARQLLNTPRRLGISLVEHHAVVDAIAAGDAAAATGAMRAHIDTVMAELFAFAQAHSALFADGEAFADGAGGIDFPFG